MQSTSSLTDGTLLTDVALADDAVGLLADFANMRRARQERRGKLAGRQTQCRMSDIVDLDVRHS